MPKISFDEILDRAKSLVDQLRTDSELTKKAMSFASHVKSINVGDLNVDEDIGVITEYLVISTDAADIYIPIQISVLDVSRIHETANEIHELVKNSLIPVVRDVYSIMQQQFGNKPNNTTDTDSSSILPVIAQALSNVVGIITNDDIIELAERIGSNVTTIELKSDSSDQETLSLVQLDNVSDINLASELMVDILDFLDRLWVSILYPFFQSVMQS